MSRPQQNRIHEKERRRFREAVCIGILGEGNELPPPHRLVYQNGLSCPLLFRRLVDATGGQETIFGRIDANIVPEVRADGCEDASAAHRHLHFAIGSRR